MTRPDLRSGRYRHKITIQRPDPASPQDALGQRVTAWLNVVVDYPANVNPISGSEKVLAAQRQASTTHEIEMRYHTEVSTVDSACRVLYVARTFTIDAPPENVGEANRQLILKCTEGPRTE